MSWVGAPFERSQRRDPVIVRQGGTDPGHPAANDYDRAMYIGELARRAGCSPKAVRLYESRGLLGAVARAGSYRIYGEQDLVLVQRIRQALGLGFRLDELHGLHRIHEATSWEALARLLRERSTRFRRTSGAFRHSSPSWRRWSANCSNAAWRRQVPRAPANPHWPEHAA